MERPRRATNSLLTCAGNFLIFSTVVGIKILNLVSNKVVRVLGEVESTERFGQLVRPVTADVNVPEKSRYIESHYDPNVHVGLISRCPQGRHPAVVSPRSEQDEY